MTASNDDFRTWNMEVETIASGHDAHGLPYFIWRESADNRLGLSRPRYCCVSVIDNELQFTFSDPSGNVRPTGALTAFKLVAGLVVLAFVLLAWFEPRPAPAPYHADMSAPPFLILVAMCFYSMTLGGVAAGIWYVAATLLRWLRDGFESDGRITQLPWRSLQSFVMMNAIDTPAGAQDKLPPSSYGLGAAFDDGRNLVLTANAWNYASMTTRHRMMTAMFITARADHLRRWNKALAEAEAEKRGGAPATDGDGVPAKL